MKKVIVFILCSLLAVGSVVPCFATEAAIIDDTGKVDLETGTVLPDSSMALPGSSTLTPSVTNNYLLNGATVGLQDGTEVSLSDESIDALATAIVEKQAAMTSNTVSYDSSYVADFHIGSNIYVPSGLLDAFPYVLVYKKDPYKDDWFALCSVDAPVYDNSDSSRPTLKFDVVFRNRTNPPPLDGFWNEYSGAEPSILKSRFGSTNYTIYTTFDVYFGDELVQAKTIDYDAPVPPVTYTVSFMTGFDGISYESQEWSEDFFPGTLTYEGYTFDGWYLDSDFTTPYSSDYTPTGDFTLFAKWIENGPMDGFHNSLFGALEALFACEPIRYILALCVLVIIVGLFKSRRSL